MPDASHFGCNTLYNLILQGVCGWWYEVLDRIPGGCIGISMFHDDYGVKVSLRVIPGEGRHRNGLWLMKWAWACIWTGEAVSRLESQRVGVSQLWLAKR